MARQPSAVMDGSSQTIATRDITSDTKPDRVSELPAQRESTMSGADLLLALKATGTPDRILIHGLSALQRKRSATANEVYSAIEDAGWIDTIRPVHGFKAGALTRENKFASTLAKARRLMDGATPEKIAEDANRAAVAGTGKLVITEEDIKNAGMSGAEYLAYVKNENARHNELVR